MLFSTPVTGSDEPVLTADFTPFLDRKGDAAVTVSSCIVTIALATADAPGGASDPDYPDATPSDRLDGDPDASVSPYVKQRMATQIEGADYILDYLATFSDGSKETIQVRQPVRKYV